MNRAERRRWQKAWMKILKPYNKNQTKRDLDLRGVSIFGVPFNLKPDFIFNKKENTLQKV